MDNIAKGFDYFESKGIQFILGAESSSIGVPAAEIATEKKMLLVSLSATSNLLSNKDDMFIRLLPTSDFLAREYAKYLYTSEGYKEYSVIYDLSNANYTIDYYESFKDEFEQLGGKITCVIEF